MEGKNVSLYEYMIKIKKINDEIVQAIPFKCVDDKPIKGACLFPEIYSNIFLVARKKSGKTSTIFKILKECVGRKSNVYIFASTVYKDKNWIHIIDYLKSKNINTQTYLGIDNENGNLEILINNLKKENIDDKKEFKKPEQIIILDNIDKKPKEKREKKKAPENFFIFDDIGDELQYKVVSQLMKTNRHFLSKVIISSQNLHDLRPEARKQLDYVLIYGGMTEDKIEVIHKELDLSITMELLMSLYKNATEMKYNFLYIDVREEEYRKNFNYKYVL